MQIAISQKNGKKRSLKLNKKKEEDIDFDFEKTLEESIEGRIDRQKDLPEWDGQLGPIYFKSKKKDKVDG